MRLWFVIACLTIFGSAGVHAQTDLQMGEPTTKYKDVELTEPMTLFVRERKLIVPYGYLGDWSGRLDFKQGATYKALNFTFWMPSRRFLYINPAYANARQVREAGRPPPKPEEYLVQVNNGYFMQEGSPDPERLTPARKLLNLVRSRTESGCYDEAKWETMGFYRSYPFQPECRALFQFFASHPGARFEFIMYCTDIDEKPKPYNPLCFADVLDKKTGFHFKLSFPTPELERMSLIIDAIDELVSSWTQGN